MRQLGERESKNITREGRGEEIKEETNTNKNMKNSIKERKKGQRDT